LPEFNGTDLAVTGQSQGGMLSIVPASLDKRVKYPAPIFLGYNDVVCPPTSMYAAYNVITAPKDLQLFLETGHWTYPEETESVNSWLIKQLKDL
jgi:cephalosporin-C deacetylase-like acetyl esterase